MSSTSRISLWFSAALALFAAASIACGSDELPPAGDDGGAGGSGGGAGGSGGSGGGAGGSGGSGGGAGGSGGSGGGSGGSGGTGGAGGGNGCDQATDDCNGGVCKYETIDCEAAATSWMARCDSGACGYEDPMTGACPPRADIVTLCEETSRASPSQNAEWHCVAAIPECGEPHVRCIIGECNP